MIGMVQVEIRVVQVVTVSGYLLKPLTATALRRLLNLNNCNRLHLGG